MGPVDCIVILIRSFYLPMTRQCRVPRAWLLSSRRSRFGRWPLSLIAIIHRL